MKTRWLSGKMIFGSIVLCSILTGCWSAGNERASSSSEAMTANETTPPESDVQLPASSEPIASPVPSTGEVSAKANTLKKLLEEHKIDLSRYKIDPEVFSAYIDDQFSGDPNEFLMVLIKLYGNDFPLILQEFDQWAAERILVQALGDKGFDVASAEIDPTDLLGYIAEYQDGDLNQFWEWYQEIVVEDIDKVAFLKDMVAQYAYETREKLATTTMMAYLNELGFDVAKVGLDSFDVRNFIENYFKGNPDTFLAYLKQNYQLNFTRFSEDFQTNRLALQSQLSPSGSGQGNSSDMFVDQPNPYPNNPFDAAITGTDITGSIPPLAQRPYDSYEAQYLHDRFMMEVIEDNFKMQYGLRITD
ncbi:hypothetical protein [Gorillibacterium timonense]|uniref:hypothetical protein n=1 Tax=Gorillibacterium timonense TaxID=1689269 RepID=UPI00071D7C54|nr:hypothetical protein [Gorillibacterium timonense]